MMSLLRKYKYLAAGLLAALTIGGGLAVAQIVLPYVVIINPTDAIQVVPYGQPSIGNKYALPSQITSQSAYYKSSSINVTGPTSNYTFSFANNQQWADFANASAAAYLYINFATGPSDGAKECVFSVGGVTTLYLAAPGTGQTLNNAVTTMAANTNYCYLFSLSNLDWDRD
jgi:hypothetical protein